MRARANRHRQIVGVYTPATKQRFAEEFQLDCDARAAAERIGRPGEGGKLLALPEVQTKIAILRQRTQSHTEIYSSAVVVRWYQLSTADARELSAVHRVNCRYCHGYDHQYQFTRDELRRTRQSHMEAQLALPESQRREFDDLGGDGFNPWGDPHPECTECGGKGLPQVWVADSRHLSPAAALLYDGVEVTRDGTMRLKLRDRNLADQQLAAHLGIAVRGSREGTPPVDPDRMSDDQLDATIERFRMLGLIENEDVDESHIGLGAD